MSFYYQDGIEKICPFFVSAAGVKPECRRNACHAFELKTEYYEGVRGSGSIFKVAYCHALKKELAVEGLAQEGSETDERKE